MIADRTYSLHPIDGLTGFTVRCKRCAFDVAEIDTFRTYRDARPIRGTWGRCAGQSITGATHSTSREAAESVMATHRCEFAP